MFAKNIEAARTLQLCNTPPPPTQPCSCGTQTWPLSWCAGAISCCCLHAVKRHTNKRRSNTIHRFLLHISVEALRIRTTFFRRPFVAQKRKNSLSACAIAECQAAAFCASHCPPTRVNMLVASYHSAVTLQFDFVFQETTSPSRVHPYKAFSSTSPRDTRLFRRGPAC
jgi:hypothetical protein